MNKELLTKTIIFTLIVVGLLFSFQSLAAAEVNINNSTAGGIQNGISKISNGDTLKLADGMYAGLNNTNITINKNLTIQGNSKSNTKINAGSLSAFNVEKGNTLTLINLTIINSYEYTDNDIARYGSMVHRTNGSAKGSGSINFENCNFINNKQTNANLSVSTNSTHGSRSYFTVQVKDNNGNNLNGDVLFYINNTLSGAEYASNGVATHNITLPR